MSTDVHKILDNHDEILLQQDLDKLMEWTKQWSLDLSTNAKSWK